MAINPATPVEALSEIIRYVDEINVMTVEPGFGGQRFIPSSPEKIRRVRALSEAIDVEVDGGVDASTAALCRDAGANVLVAGSFVFEHPDGPGGGVRALRGVLG